MAFHRGMCNASLLLWNVIEIQTVVLRFLLSAIKAYLFHYFGD